MAHDIERFQTNPRLSRILAYRELVFLAGATATDRSQDTAGQMRQVLARIDEQLADAGSDKSLILDVSIILRHAERDIDQVNEIWVEWLDGLPGPARAAWGGELVKPDILVEIKVSALRRMQDTEQTGTAA